jgi:hypothetical protein
MATVATPGEGNRVVPQATPQRYVPEPSVGGRRGRPGRRVTVRLTDRVRFA